MGRTRIEPSADMREVAASMFQIFTAFRDAGFTAAQAMEFVTITFQQGLNATETPQDGPNLPPIPPLG